MFGGVFHQFPYTNFHEMNMDWLLKENYKTREIAEEAKSTAEEAKQKAEEAAAKTAELELTTDADIFDEVTTGSVVSAGAKYGKLATISLGITGAASASLLAGVLNEKYRPAIDYIQSGILSYDSTNDADIHYTLRIGANGNVRVMQDDPGTPARDAAFTVTFVTA